MNEVDAVFRGRPGQLRRRWLSGRFVVGSNADYAANSLFGQQTQVRCEQLPARKDLRRNFKYAHL